MLDELSVLFELDELEDDPESLDEEPESDDEEPLELDEEDEPVLP